MYIIKMIKLNVNMMRCIFANYLQEVVWMEQITCMDWVITDLHPLLHHIQIKLINLVIVLLLMVAINVIYRLLGLFESTLILVKPCGLILIIMKHLLWMISTTWNAKKCVCLINLHDNIIILNTREDDND